MEALQSAIDDIAARDLPLVSDDELETGQAEIHRAISRLEALLARRAGEAKRRGSYQRHGLVSLTRWLAVHADMDNSEARSLVALANTMARHPDTGARIASGELSHTRAHVLSRAAQAHPEVYQRDEEMLLGFARDLTMSDLNRSVRYWRNYADDTLAEATAAEQRQAAYLHLGHPRRDGTPRRVAGP